MDDFDGRDLIVLEAAEQGVLAYEKPLPELLACCVSHGPSTLIDVGANTGLFSILAASVSPEVSVVAFEPMKQICSMLRVNVGLNPSLKPQIRIEEKALSSTSGVKRFYETLNDRGFLSTSSTLELDHARSVAGEFRSTDVEVATLDTLHLEQACASTVLLKVDAEGHEQDVVQGGLAFIRRYKPLMIVEMLEASKGLAYFQQFVDREHYVNFAFAGRALKREQAVQFERDSWNHVLCPVEKVYDLAVAAQSAGLQLL
jgi:FkbM family methyltransferase